MRTGSYRASLWALAGICVALSGCPEEDCNQTGCDGALVCAAVCDDWTGGCSNYECVECGDDWDCAFGEICRENACRASHLDIPCSEFCSSDECALPSECVDNGMVCTDLDDDPWGNCMTPCTTNLDCPGTDDRAHWVRCLDCLDQPAFCTYNSHPCPGEENDPGPSGTNPCDYSGCMEVCIAAGGSNCGTDCSCD
jgi:hypothetical protein